MMTFERSEKSSVPPYGDLKELNTNRLILDSVGEETLVRIVNELLNMLETSVAVYEKNGDYALGLFTSNWCKYLDQASRALCDTDDNREALACGKWLCHESCWSKASQKVLKTGRPVDIECDGGINIYGVPIRANDEIIGVINFGYGDPPTDPAVLEKITEKYRVNFQELSEKAKSYRSKPSTVVDAAKKHLKVLAHLIGEIVERTRTLEALRKNEEDLAITLNSISDAVIVTDEKGRITRMNPVAESLCGWSLTDAVGKSLKQVFKIVNSETRKPVADPVSIVLERGKVVGLANHTLLISKNGNEYQISDGCAPIFDSENRLIGTVMVFRDVTEDYALRKTIRDKEVFLSVVFDSIQHGICVLNPDMSILAVNDTMKRWYAHSLPLEGKKCYQAYHGRSSECDVCPTIKVLKTGKPDMKEVPLVQKGEVTGVLELYAFPVVDDKGKVTQIIEYVHDITERVKADEALTESNERNLAILEAIPDLMFTFDKKGVFIDFNFHRSDDLYMMPGDFLNRHVSQVLPPKVAQLTVKQLNRLFGTGKAQIYEYSLAVNDKYRQYECRLVLCGKEKALALVREITDRKLAEQNLRETKEELERYFSSSLDLLCIANTEGYFLRLNPEWEKVLGYKIEDLEGKKFFDLIHTDDQEATLKAVSVLRGEEEILNFENRYICKDGSYRWIEWRSKPQGDLIYAAARDITDRKIAEEKLKYKIEMEKLLSEVSAKSANLSEERFDPAINEVIEMLGHFFDVDRVYIFQISSDGKSTDNTHEWCNKGIEPQIDNLQNIPVSDLPWGMEKLSSLGMINISSVDEMPADAENEKAILKAQGIRSVLIVPLIAAGNLLGFMGFDTVRGERCWSEEEPALIKVAAEIVSGAIVNEQGERRLRYERAQLLSIFDSINEIIYVSDPVTHEIIYVNQAMRRNYSYDPLGGKCYRELQNRETPCEFCTNPIILKNRGEPYQWEFYNPSVDRTFLITDRIITWPDGRDVRFEMAVDITERKRAEQALKLSEERYRLIAENTADFIWTTDLNLDFTYISPSVKNIRGFTDKEALQQSLEEIHTPETVERILAIFQEEMAREKEGKADPRRKVTYESEEYCKDGSLVTIENTVTFLRDHSGQPIGVLGISHNITERKRYEKELEQSQRRFEQLAEQSLTFIWEVDSAGKYTYLSNSVEKVLGYSAKELISKKHFYDLCSQEDKEEIRSIVLSLIRDNKELHNLEKRMICKDNRVIWLNSSGVSVKDERGIVSGFRGSDTDVTDRKENEEKIKSQKERLDNIITGTNAGTWEWNVQTGEVIFNEKFAELCGYTLEELSPVSQETWVKLTHPDDLWKDKKQLDSHFQGEVDHFSAELRMQHKDGRWIWILDKGKVISWTKDKKPLLMYGTVIDITEAKRNEHDLQSQKERLNNIIEGTNAGSWEWNVQTGEVIFSRKWAEILGYTLEELLPLSVETWNRVVHPEDLPTNDALLDMHFKGEAEYFACELRMKSKNGSWVWILDKGKVISRTEEGKPVWMYGTIVDISERKEAEIKLRENEARAQKQKNAIAQLMINPAVISGDVSQAIKIITKTLAETIDVERSSVWLLSQNGEELKCLSLYKQSEKKESEGEVLKTSVFPNFFKAINRESRISAEIVQEDERTKELCDSYLKPLGITSMLDAGIQLEGRFAGVVSLEHTGVPRKWHPDEEFFISMIASLVSQILTEEQRKVAEQSLVRVQKMESIGKLAGGIAHDYNNMLMIILNYAEMALAEISQDSPINRYVNEISVAAKRSALITSQLLAFARKQPVKPEVVDLNRIITDMYSMLKNLIVEEIQINWKPAEDLWTIRIDPAQIDQIIANLLINAREAITGIGEITIETGNITTDEELCRKYPDAYQGEFVFLRVKDTGIGMSEYIMSQIFSPFFSTKDISKNSGLGLATVYGIMKQNTGFISVESTLGKGAQFTLFFPRYESREEETNPPDKSPEIDKAKIIGKETIVLIDDEKGVLEVVAPMLERFGYTVLPANSPKEALSMAKNHAGSIDLMVSDVIMPEMNGYQLKEEMLKIYPDLKCLFMTGYSEDIIVNRGIVRKDVHLIQKPFLSMALAQKVREVLDN